MKQDNFDLMVIGGGPAGYVAAIRASQLGFRTAIFEKEHLGGACLNWGCIPTKALLHGAEVASMFRSAGELGFYFDNFRFDLGRLVAHSRRTAERLKEGIKFLVKKNNITLIQDKARLIEGNALAVRCEKSSSIYEAGHILLATGARPRQMPSIPIDGKKIWGAREAIRPERLPSRILVIGGGAIGVEFASLYRDLGSEVVLVELKEHILPSEDYDISNLAKDLFIKRGIQVFSSTKVDQIKDDGDGVTAVLIEENGKVTSIYFDKVIVAVGVAGNVEGMGLEEKGVSISKEFIDVDEFGFTNIKGIYAIGDVAGPPWIAHKASRQGMVCVEKIAGFNVKPLDTTTIPLCTYCRPQVASVGLTEAEASARGYDLRVGRSKYESNGKSMAIGEALGFVKTIFDRKTGELLGAHMIGHMVSEQIHGFSIGRALETTEAEILEAVFPHPTISESIYESVLDAFERSIHH